MPLAYLLATVITGLGLLIGSLIHVSHPEQIARNSVTPVVVEPKAFVGRITGMVDCKWEKEGSGIRGQGVRIGNQKSLVVLGDKFSLASGLMEITYDSGAKVILQGPVTYEVDSNGGYLAVGKLTGKLEKRGVGWGTGGEKRVLSSSFIIHPSSFVIRTPTATVTDLGTEFGVEVDGQDATKVYVFDGAVRSRIRTSKRARRFMPVTPFRLAGDRIRRLDSGEAPKYFVRTMRPRTGPLLLADDFNDNSLDLTKWRTNTSLSAGHARVVEQNQRMELINRGHLITRKEYYPDNLGGIEITGRWNFAKGQQNFLEILTRADGVPNKAYYDETRNGLDFMLFTRGALPTKLEICAWGFCGMSVEHRCRQSQWSSTQATPSTSKSLTAALGLSFTLTQVGNPSNTASATAVLAANCVGYGHVVFHNCQFEGQDEVAYLDDVSIVAPAKLFVGDSAASRPAAKEKSANTESGGKEEKR